MRIDGVKVTRMFVGPAGIMVNYRITKTATITDAARGISVSRSKSHRAWVKSSDLAKISRSMGSGSLLTVQVQQSAAHPTDYEFVSTRIAK